MADPVTVWLLSRESVAKSPCKCGSLPGIYTDLEVRVKTVDMLQKDGMIDRLEERLKRLEKEVNACDEAEIA